MGSFLDILCCSGGSHEENLQPTTAKYQSTHPNSNNSKVQPSNKVKSTTKYSSTEIAQPLKATKSKHIQELPTPSNNKKSEMQPQSQSSIPTNSNTKKPTNKPHGVATSRDDHDKTDVTVYEATDSTLDTSNEHYEGGAGSISVSKASADQSVYDSEEVGDEYEDYDINSDENNDDLFDLTKLQPGQAHAPNGWLLEPAPDHLKNRKCLILDLDETLVHSSFKYLRHADFVIPVDIDNQLHNVYVIKRPGVDEFMRRVGEIYEVVVFTASVSRYGDPLLDALDIHKSVHHRLFRDSCYNYQGNYIKNLSQIGRPLSELIILDNSPASYVFHPQHAIPISSWFSDAHDNELLDIIPFLEDLAKDNVEDIGLVLDINL